VFPRDWPLRRRGMAATWQDEKKGKIYIYKRVNITMHCPCLTCRT
jgi:hypothetical protein